MKSKASADVPDLSVLLWAQMGANVRHDPLEFKSGSGSLPNRCYCVALQRRIFLTTPCFCRILLAGVLNNPSDAHTLKA